MTTREQLGGSIAPATAQALIRAGLAFRKALLAGKRDLRPFGPSYRVLDDAMDSVDRTLEAVAGKPLNYRADDMGLLAPAGGACPPWEQPG